MLQTRLPIGVRQLFPLFVLPTQPTSQLEIGENRGKTEELKTNQPKLEFGKKLMQNEGTHVPGQLRNHLPTFGLKHE